MQTFFVEIKCALGRTYEVASALAEAEIASEIYSIAGDHDILAKFYVEAGVGRGQALRALFRLQAAGVRGQKVRSDVRGRRQARLWRPRRPRRAAGLLRRPLARAAGGARRRAEGIGIRAPSPNLLQIYF